MREFIHLFSAGQTLQVFLAEIWVTVDRPLKIWANITPNDARQPATNGREPNPSTNPVLLGRTCLGAPRFIPAVSHHGLSLARPPLNSIGITFRICEIPIQGIIMSNRRQIVDQVSSWRTRRMRRETPNRFSSALKTHPQILSERSWWV